jgi:hypothetical protein
MDSTYIRALNAGFLWNGRDDGQVRDKAVLREAKRLYRATPEKPVVETEAFTDGAERSTIPPPTWREPKR